jgi:hypothetical protein
MSAAQQDDPYVGWIRENGGLWRRVVSGHDAATVLGKLLAYPVRGNRIERVVLSGGKTPERTR